MLCSVINGRSKHEYSSFHVVFGFARLNKISGMASGDVNMNCDNELMDDDTDVVQTESGKKLRRNLFDLNDFDIESEVTVPLKSTEITFSTSLGKIRTHFFYFIKVISPH